MASLNLGEKSVGLEVVPCGSLQETIVTPMKAAANKNSFLIAIEFNIVCLLRCVVN